MAKQVLIRVGTKKGAFIVDGGAERHSWRLRGPFCETWPMNHVVGDPASGTIYGGGGNAWFGAAGLEASDPGAALAPFRRGVAQAAGGKPGQGRWCLGA